MSPTILSGPPCLFSVSVCLVFTTIRLMFSCLLWLVTVNVRFECHCLFSTKIEDQVEPVVIRVVMMMTIIVIVIMITIYSKENIILEFFFLCCWVHPDPRIQNRVITQSFQNHCEHLHNKYYFFFFSIFHSKCSSYFFNNSSPMRRIYYRHVFIITRFNECPKMGSPCLEIPNQSWTRFWVFIYIYVFI